MNTILVLTDFSRTAQAACLQAALLAAEQKADIILCHVVAEHSAVETIKAADEFAIHYPTLAREEVAYTKVILQGELIPAIAEYIEQSPPDMVLVATHGKVGAKQKLFGSTIYELVKSLTVDVMVVNDELSDVKPAFDRIMLPVSSHADYLNKVKVSAQLLSKEGKLVIFTIHKFGGKLDEDIRNNIDNAERYLKERNVAYEHLEVDSSRFSVGYSKETLLIAEEHGIDLIVIMAQVSDQALYYGRMDKENVILNAQGMPVLCVA